MSEAAGTSRWWGAGQGPSGATGLIVAFVIGAIFALVPTYYMGREAGLQSGAARDPAFDSPVETPRGSSGPPSRNASKPFASRMTYELSHLPQERFPPPPKALTIVAPAAPVAVAPAPAARPPVIATPPLPPAEELPAERVANARPISALPPDPRDRTREIEKEREKAEYREPAARPVKAAPPPPVGKVIEGREVELKPRLPEVPTRPIAAGSGVDTRAEIEAERNTRTNPTPAPSNPTAARDAVKKSSEKPAAAAKDPARKSTEGTALAAKKAPEAPSAVTPGPQVAGVSPITPPPQVPDRNEALPAKASAGGSTAAATAAGLAPAASGNVKGRLDVTREWLAAAPQTTHTIQLMGTNSEEQLKGQLQSLSKVLDPTKLYIFRTMAQGKPSITVVYGAYADRQHALQALEKLPASVSANRPVLRTVNGIRTEMKQHKTEKSE